MEVRVLDKSGSEMQGQTLAWTSSDPSIVEAVGEGRLTAKKSGRAKLIVSCGKISATIPVEIVDLSEIVVAPASLKLLGPPGTSARLEVSGKTLAGQPAPVPPVAWSAEDPRVVKVAPDGTVTSLAPGKTMVLARLGDLLSESEIRVQNKTISRLELRPETAILHVNESQKFTALAYDEKGLLMPDAGAQFASLNPDLVKISGEGKATALAKGTAVVSATLAGKVARATVLID
ncbi:MAG: Ig-like domain-containing protein [Thermoanaerobaculia bacterium]